MALLILKSSTNAKESNETNVPNEHGEKENEEMRDIYRPYFVLVHMFSFTGKIYYSYDTNLTTSYRWWCDSKTDVL